AALLLVVFAIVLVAKLFALLVRVVGWPLQRVFDLGFSAVSAAYPRVLRALLARPVGMFVVLAAAVAGGWLVVREARDLGTEMLPTVHQGELVAHVYLPVG